jgi:hypothetical protein
MAMGCWIATEVVCGNCIPQVYGAVIYASPHVHGVCIHQKDCSMKLQK